VQVLLHVIIGDLYPESACYDFSENFSGTHIMCTTAFVAVDGSIIGDLYPESACYDSS
jgi:hypothetical protein